MSVLVTGGNGVVGRALVRQLVAEERNVICLSRSTASDHTLSQIGAQTVRGDILDPASLTTAMNGVETVFHVAGINAFCVSDSAPMFRGNVEGSTNVVTACQTVGVRRLVYTSSAATLGERSGTVGDEQSEHRGHYLSEYERSKHVAEMAVLGMAGGLDIISVNPSSVQGPGRATGTGKLILDLINGRLPALVNTRLSIVDIEDCARGHILAEQHGRPGERYVLNGFTLEMAGAVELLQEVGSRRLDVRFIPGWVAMAAGTTVEVVSRLRRTHPRVCREMVRTMLHGHAYDGSKATRELGLVYTPAIETLRRLVDWFRSEGLIDPS